MVTETMTTTSLRALLKFPLQGRDWQNRFLIGSGLSLAGSFIPILPGIVIGGYALEVARRAAAGEELELPPWSDWGRLFVDGLRASLVSLVFLLPGALVLGLGWVAYMAGMFAIPLSEGSGTDVGVLLMFGGLTVFFLSLAAGMLLLLLGAIPLPAALAHVAARGQVAAGFRVREWWPILRANALGYVVAWVVAFGLWTILSQVLTIAYYTIVLCCLVPILAAPVGFYLTAVGAALFGRTYREGAELVEERTEVVTA